MKERELTLFVGHRGDKHNLLKIIVHVVLDFEIKENMDILICKKIKRIRVTINYFMYKVHAYKSCKHLFTGTV